MRHVSTEPAATTAAYAITLGRFRACSPDRQASGQEPACVTRDHRAPDREQDQRRQEWVERGVQQQDLVEREQACPRRKSRGQQRGALSEPVARGPVDQPHRHRAEHDLQQTDAELGPEHRDRSGQEIDVQRRDEEGVPSRGGIRAEHAVRQGHVIGAVRATHGLQQRMVVQSCKNNRLRDRGERQDQRQGVSRESIPATPRRRGSRDRNTACPGASSAAGHGSVVWRALRSGIPPLWLRESLAAPRYPTGFRRHALCARRFPPSHRRTRRLRTGRLRCRGAGHRG